MSPLKVYYDYAISFLGTNYKWGGSNPISGLDCSGFIQELASCLGIDPAGDQTAQQFYDSIVVSGTVCSGKDFKRGSIAPGLELGAFAFYGESTRNINHVTALLNNWQCIGANGGNSKVIDKLTADRANAFVKIRPVDYRKDLVAIVLPSFPNHILSLSNNKI